MLQALETGSVFTQEKNPLSQCSSLGHDGIKDQVNEILAQDCIEFSIDIEKGVPTREIQLLKKILFYDMAEWRPEGLVSTYDNPYLEPQDSESIQVVVKRDDDLRFASYRFTPGDSKLAILSRAPFDIPMIQDSILNSAEVVEWTNLLPFFSCEDYDIAQEKVQREARHALMKDLFARSGQAPKNMRAVLKTVGILAGEMGYTYIRTFTSDLYLKRYLGSLDEVGREILSSSIKFQGIVPNMRIDGKVDDSVMYIIEMPVGIVEHILDIE